MSERGGVLPLIQAIRMPGATETCKGLKAWIFIAAESASVLILLISLIQGMLSFVRAVGMSVATETCEGLHAWVFVSAVFAVVV